MIRGTIRSFKGSLKSNVGLLLIQDDWGNLQMATGECAGLLLALNDLFPGFMMEQVGCIDLNRIRGKRVVVSTDQGGVCGIAVDTMVN